MNSVHYIELHGPDSRRLRGSGAELRLAAAQCWKSLGQSQGPGAETSQDETSVLGQMQVVAGD